MNKPNVVWKPLPGAQTLIASCPANELLSDGTRASGKTENQLMRFRRLVGRYGAFCKGVIFDREYKNLDDIVSRGNRLFPMFGDGCKWHAAKSDYKWTWPTGEELLIRSIKKSEDYNNFHGQEFCLAVGELVCLRRGDVPIEDVVIGDEILTAEGYRKVNRVFPRKVSECNFIVVFDRSGELVGEQIQSVDHRVLTSDRSTFSKLRGELQDSSRSAANQDLLQQAILRYLDRGCSFETEDSRYPSKPCEASTCNNCTFPLISETSFSGSLLGSDPVCRSAPSVTTVLPKCVRETFDVLMLRICRIVWQSLSSYEFSKTKSPLRRLLERGLRPTTSSQNAEESFGQSAKHTEDLRTSRSDRLRIVERVRQVLRSFVARDQREGGSVGLETTRDSRVDCSKGSCQCGEQLLRNSTIVQEIALLPPDVLRHNLQQREDGSVLGGTDTCELSSYIHPYSLEKRVAISQFQTGICVAFPCGPRETIDIEVDDTNSYITPSGILSSNCFIGWNELTKFPTSELYDKMMSCNRCGRPDVPLWVHSTTNPSGPGHSWVKKRFIDPAPAGKLIRVVTNAFNPATQQYEDVVTTRVRIFSSYKENPYLSPKYIAGLENISDENTKKAWLYGDWDVQGGGALDDVWGPWNIVPRFRIPPSWRVDRSFDWGSTHPFSVGWWAQSSGEECILPDGTRWAPPKNSLFRIFELYGSEEIGTNRGIKMSAVEIADLVAKYDHALFENGWIQSPVYPGPADNQINNVVEADSWTIAHRMSERGVNWTLSDKSRGARYTGLELFRQMLINSRRGEGPGIFFMDHCKAALETLPILPRDDEDPDDVDTTAEDHLYDECRYRILAGASNVVSELPVHYPR